MKDDILGVFAEFNPGPYEKNIPKDVIKKRDEQSKLFHEYLWGPNTKGGLSSQLKNLKYGNYGSDLNLILFKFRVSPRPTIFGEPKPIDNYRPKEKSFGA